MKVPKTIGELRQISLDDDGGMYDGIRFKDGCRPARAVLDDLILARFAFEGHKVVPEDAVVLTAKEADALFTWADRCRIFMEHVPEKLNDAELIIALIARKLTAAEPKACEHKLIFCVKCGAPKP